MVTKDNKESVKSQANLKESVNIKIDDSEELSQDIDFTLSTKLGNTSSITTGSLNKKLMSVIVSTNKAVDIKICFAELPDIFLLDLLNFTGSAYIPLKILSKDYKGDVLNFSSTEWYLNNRLTITISGGNETDTNFTLRCK